MRKKILFVFGLVLFYACSLEDDGPNFRYELLTIDDYTVPSSFILGKQDTIKLKYSLKNSCYSFDDVYYEYQDTTRIVAIRAFVTLDEACAEVITQKEYDLLISPSQTEDYVFKFWKGVDGDGKNIFEEVVVPVN